MLRSGKEHLQSLRDGRVVYVGGERIDDVTTHPAFRAAAQTVAGIYDLKADPAHRDSMTYEEDGGRHSIYFLKPKTREDLQKRSNGRSVYVLDEPTTGLHFEDIRKLLMVLQGLVDKGNTVIPAGTTYATTEPKLESMNYLVEGVAGSTS